MGSRSRRIPIEITDQTIWKGTDHGDHGQLVLYFAVSDTNRVELSGICDCAFLKNLHRYRVAISSDVQYVRQTAHYVKSAWQHLDTLGIQAKPYALNWREGDPIQLTLPMISTLENYTKDLKEVTRYLSPAFMCHLVTHLLVAAVGATLV